MTWMRVPSAVSANTASGLEFSPQISALIGPNSVWNAPKVSPKPPMWTSRSPTVGMIFWCLPISAAVGPEVDLGVEHGPDGARDLLAGADHDIGVGVARGGAERVGLRARDLDRVLEQLGRELVGDRAGRGMVVVPDRMRRDEALREADHPRAVRCRPRGSAGRPSRSSPRDRGTPTRPAPPRPSPRRRRHPCARRGRLLRRLAARRALVRPVGRIGLGALECVLGLEARRHRAALCRPAPDGARC